MKRMLGRRQLFEQLKVSPGVVLEIFVLFCIDGVDFPLSARCIEQRRSEKSGKAVESTVKSFRSDLEVVLTSPGT